MPDGPAGTFTAELSRDGSYSLRRPLGLPQRVGALALLFTVELIILSAWVDTSVLRGKPGLLGLIEDGGKPALQSMVGFAALFLTFGYLQSKTTLRRISDGLFQAPIQWGFLGGHVAVMAAFAGLTSILFNGDQAGIRGDLVAGIWILAGTLGIVTAACAAIPSRLWLDLFRSTGTAWAYAAGGALILFPLASRSVPLWQPATALTFQLVRLLLSPFLPDIIADPATSTIGTSQFKVMIGWGCSGIEGLGLILVFSVAWLLYFRRELRFPQALVLIPAGVVVLWSLNAVRITALILIGTAGAPGVAVGGFHSAAGWISFNAVALGLSLVAQRAQWFTGKDRPQSDAAIKHDNPTAAYLIPFLAILAAAMIGRASSSTFEWLYPLRFFVAAVALWMFRDKYANLNWRFGWLAPVAGTIVFALWLGLDRFRDASPDPSLGLSLAALPAWGRVVWIVFRTLAAVITVPIAEELAFRGFLMRRLISPDFESVGLQVFRIFAVILSSLAFGVLHGDRWVAGAVAGLIYAGAALWRGRIGDAVVAHGVSNALIAAWVLTRGNWDLW